VFCFYDPGSCVCPPPAFFNSEPLRVPILIEEGLRPKGGVIPVIADLSSSRSVPPEALEPRGPERALAALAASSGDLPREAGQGGGQQGVRNPPL